MIQTDCATESWPTCSCIRCSFGNHRIAGVCVFVLGNNCNFMSAFHLSSSRLVGCTTTPLRKRSPYWGSPGNYSNPCGLQAQAALSFLLRGYAVLLSHGVAQWKWWIKWTCHVLHANCHACIVQTRPQKWFTNRHKIFFASEHAATFYKRSAQLVFCCESYVSEDKNQNYRQWLSGRNSAHWQLDIHTDPVRSVFSGFWVRESRLIVRAFAETNLANHHYMFESI